MKLQLSAFISLSLVLFLCPLYAFGAVSSSSQSSTSPLADPPRHSTSLTNVVQWDNYTLFVNNQRIFLYSGEFHAFRLPVPDLWSDIFQKFKAAGLNGVSIYNHWGLANPSRGVVDFDHWRDLQSLFDAAKAAGLFIVFRPGPYINAETTAGGIAHWVTTETAGELRTNATDYRETWQQYIQAIIKFTVPNQITHGGPVIALQVDNEYTQTPIAHAEYFAELEATYRAGGIAVPLTYNDAGQGKHYINGTGAPDLYGMDAYPQRYNCGQPDVWHQVDLNYHEYHIENNPSEPWYLPEFQGGSLDPWGGAGYDGCEELTGPNFQDVFYKNNWASNAKLISYYMFYGGTSWGALPYPGVYTSYDYGGTIRENRALGPKFDEIKRQALFLRSSPEFRKTDWIGNSSAGAVGINNVAAFATLLRNPDSGTGFYITRQNDSTSTANIAFTLSVSTSKGSMTLPQVSSSIELNGRQSKVIVTDYSFGSSKLLYSTASIFFAGKIGSQNVLFLFGDSDQSHEIALELTPAAHPIKTTSPLVKFSNLQGSSESTIVFLPGIQSSLAVWESPQQLILFADSVTVASFWAPVISSNASSLGNYWQFGSNETVLVGGPYLVRDAKIHGSELLLTGDLNASVPLTVVAPPNIQSVSWNNAVVSNAIRSPFSSLIKGNLKMKPIALSVKLPTLTNWKFKDSLPEVSGGFSDEAWITANHTTTNIIPKPFFGDGRVLYGCDYGFCEGIVLWRGHFNATGSETSVNLSISGGTAFAASVWINDVFIRSTPSDNSTPNTTNEVFVFPSGSVRVSQDNIITVVQDNMGLDESNSTTADASKSQRGISGVQLNTGNFTTWKVQGKLGGYKNYPDKVRGVLNEGGLFGEREGWHLPGFDTSSWQTRPLSAGLPGSEAGVGFFVTTFDLNVPADTDVPMSFIFEDNSERYRAILFVNGWNYGKRVGNLGPQVKFPVPQGLLDYNGKNTVAIALWTLDSNTTVTVSPKLTIVADTFIEGGVGSIAVNNPGWSPRWGV
ncbi:glycoside hydrolase family 35 protein [Sphaerobolus stellatus SS14]|nr:glycoside hydrolase family 35 protein [Sphaerobolus stellatus SS14]